MRLLKIVESDDKEIKNLNGGFKQHTKKIRATLDTTSDSRFYLAQFPHLLFKILKLFPNIAHHKCHQDSRSFPNQEFELSKIGIPIKIVGDVIDTVHLLEHVVLEIQCQIDDMDECSGLTCNYWEPRNRYDVFIECEHPELAAFSFKTGLQLFESLLHAPKSQNHVDDLLQMARAVRVREAHSIESIAHALDWTVERAKDNMHLMQELNFPFQQLRYAL